MPKNKFQDVVFTIIMATIMVYGMVVYNIALNTGTVDGTTFIAALHELPIMVPVAFILEFFIVGRLARLLAFTVMEPTDRPQFITYAISICICCIMCPVMSLVATILFKEPSFGMWVKTSDPITGIYKDKVISFEVGHALGLEIPALNSWLGLVGSYTDDNGKSVPLKFIKQ